MAEKQLGAPASADEDAITKGELAAVVSRVFLSADRVNNNATANTIADVTGLAFPVVAGKYKFTFCIYFTSAASTTGARFAVNGPTLTSLTLRTIVSTAAAANVAANVNAYDSPAAANTAGLTAGAIATLDGFIEVSASGSVIARFASEISSSAITVKAGSYVEYFKIP